MIYTSKSYEETIEIARNFSKSLKKGDIVAFFGDLGAGKTAFSYGVISGMGILSRVTSPTYNIVNEYDGICHFDMYRIQNEDELWDIGFEDYLCSGNILLIEWAENIKSSLPNNYISVEIEKGEDIDERIIKIQNFGDTDKK